MHGMVMNLVKSSHYLFGLAFFLPRHGTLRSYGLREGKGAHAFRDTITMLCNGKDKSLGQRKAGGCFISKSKT